MTSYELTREASLKDVADVLRSGKSFNINELAEEAGRSEYLVKMALDDLESKGFINKRKAGQKYYYQLMNSNCDLMGLSDFELRNVEAYAILSGLNYADIVSALPKCKGRLIERGWRN